MVRFLAAVLIGIGLTLAWQSYGEEAKQFAGPWVRETVTSWAPSLAWLLPSWTQSPSQLKSADTPAKQTASAKPTASSPIRELPPDNAPGAQPVSATGTTTAPPAAAASPEVAQQLEAMARNLAAVGRSVEQLAAKQEQIVEKIATLQAEIGQKLSSQPVPPAVAMPLNENAPRPAAAPGRRAPSPAR